MSRYKDADAMIRELKRQYMFLFGTDEIPNGIGMFLENFPTADVQEVVHGEWKHTVTGYPYCSNCDWMPEEDEMLHTDYYCPNCGAKMDGEK